MNGFTKLFSSIVTSTIWQEDPETKVVWITLLALADPEGFVDGTVPGIANIARISVKKTRIAINKLESPDPDSRTPDYDGKRIAKVDGGWILLNYAKYRKVRDMDERKEYMRQYMQDYRKHHVNNPVNNVNNVNQCKPQLAHTEAEAEAELKNTKRHSILVWFDYENRTLTGLTDQDYLDWSEAFPAVDVRQEIKSACQWLIDNPTKRKKQVRRYLTNWLRRTQERGGSRTSKAKQPFDCQGHYCSSKSDGNQCGEPAIHKYVNDYGLDYYRCELHKRKENKCG
jgi:hypothetical protein